MNATEVSNILTNHLRLIDGGVSTFDNRYRFNHNVNRNVYPRYYFITEVNDFPTLCFYALETQYTHIGNAVRYATTLIHLRGYVYEEDASTRAEDLLADIDHALSHLRRMQPCFSDCRVLQLSTDSGFMEPYGVADMMFTVTYLQELEDG
jgi:hypothetical protein